MIEIKCPYSRKTDNINVVIQNSTYLRKDQDNNFVLKEKHTYYAQIQFGMTLLNSKETDFILFASYDKSVKIVTVDFDKEYAKDLLLSLKSSFFNNMLLYLCTRISLISFLLHSLSILKPLSTIIASSFSNKSNIFHFSKITSSEILPPYALLTNDVIPPRVTPVMN